MKAAIATACLLLACFIGPAFAGKAESLVLPTFSPPSPPPPPLAGHGCPSLELAFVLHQYSYLNFGNDEGAAVCKAIRAKTAYKYATCEFIYRYGYRSSNELPALLPGVIGGANPSTVVFVSIKFGIPQLPNQQKWYDEAAKARNKLMVLLSYQPTLEAIVQKAIHWDGKVTTLENCAAFMFGYDTYTSDPFETEFTYWAPHPSPPDVLPDSPDFVPTPPFIYFGGKGCPCYYDVDIIEWGAGVEDEEYPEEDGYRRKLKEVEEEVIEEEIEEGYEGEDGHSVAVPAQPFSNPTCQVFLNSDNKPAGKYYNFPDSYWSAQGIYDGNHYIAAYGVRGCYTELPKATSTKCSFHGKYTISPLICPGKVLSFSIADCSATGINLRKPNQANGARKEFILASYFDSEGTTTVAPIKANRNCPIKYISNAPAPALSSVGYKFKIVPTGTDCSTVRLEGVARPAKSKFLGVNAGCTTLKFTKAADHGSVFKLTKL